MPGAGSGGIEIERLKELLKTLREAILFLFRLGFKISSHVGRNVRVGSLEECHHAALEGRGGAAEVRHDEA